MIPRILHISSSKTWRGGEQQLAYLIEELTKKEVKQWVLCAKNSAMENYCQKQKIPFFTFRKIFSANPFIALKVRKICLENQISIVHPHDSHGLTYAVWGLPPSPLKRELSLASISKTKVGTDSPFRGLGDKNPQIIISRRVDFPINSKWKYNHRSVKKILCVSNFVKKIIEKDIRKKEILEVVYDGIDLEKFKYSNQNILRTEFQIPKGIPIIANIAAIAPHKDYFTFVNTVEILVQKNVSAKFLIIGADGGEQSKIEAFIQSKNLEQHIILTGFRNDIPQIFPEIDVLLFTSKTEGLGTTILDAMACEVPVVATQAGGIPEILEDGKTGFLGGIGNAEELAEKVMIFLRNSEIREEIISAAKGHVNNFSKEKMAEKTLQAYLED